MSARATKLATLERDAPGYHLRIKIDNGEASSEAPKEILDLMGLTMDDARRILPKPTQPPDPT